MRKIALFILAGLLAACTATQQPAPVTQLDVESLNKDIDLDMDISQLRLSDLNILRHVFAAQKGYPFEDSYLRSIYGSTTWYDSLMWAFDGSEQYFNQVEYDDTKGYRDNYYGSIKPEVLALTPEQQAFIDRIDRRIEELRSRNFKPAGGKVNMANIINPALIDSMDERLYEHLGNNGFAIVPARHQQLFHVYEQNDYHEFPSFVTTDLYLQLYHLYFDCMLRELEQHKLDSLVDLLCLNGYEQMKSLARTQDVKVKEAALWLKDYFAVALNLNGTPVDIDSEAARQEVKSILASTDGLSEFLGYKDAKFAYSLFKPRGHYTRNKQLERYFRSMMWLQTVPFRTDKPEQLNRVLILSEWIGQDQTADNLYRQLTEPMTYLMGQPDNVSAAQVAQCIRESSLTAAQLIGQPDRLQTVRQRIEAIAKEQTRIKPKFNRSGEYKINLMPQRYQPDAEVLQELVDYKSVETKRDTPKGLDVFAAMGVARAENILLNELGEGGRWTEYKPTLDRMKQRMDSVDWTENASVQWLSALKIVTEKPQNAPYFMMSDEWDRKSLNAALASWTELKHDAILYAKQPFGAECGGGGPPDPVVKGYVEPNVRFWQKAINLLTATKTMLQRYGLMSEKMQVANQSLLEKAEFLLAVSQKELKGEVLKDEEYDQLEYIGAAFENISLELLRDAEHELWNWEAVQGPDRKVALVADVYTANADNNPNKSILFEAIGDADEIYVVVEVGGYLHLMRGAVFSYREFKRPLDDQRLNDEEWQQYLEKHPREGVPQWMQPIIVPLDNAPVDNESVFYSTGC